jgi:integrase/recombinase XerD
MPKRPRATPPVQPGLFPDAPAPMPPEPAFTPLTPLPAVTDATTLAGLALPYRSYLLLGEHTAHTIDCFLSDLHLLAEYLGSDTPLRDLSPQDLSGWLSALRWGSATTPAPKTIARRVTFLRNCFGWLADIGVLPGNLTEKMPPLRPSSPLPDLLHDDELARLIEMARGGDPRTIVLLMLALDGGLKKEEILALTVDRVDCGDPAAPTVMVRLPGNHHPQRERMVALPAAFTEYYQRYVSLYLPQERVFECTERNLTYILARLVRRAKIMRPVTLQLLRDCFAVRQLRAGVPPEQVREKLGLTDETWYEAQVRYRRLAFPV